MKKNLADGGGGTSREQNIRETPISARTPHATTWQHLSNQSFRTP